VDRRQVLRGAAATSLTLVAGRASAWEPTRPITIVVGFAPGGGTDILARQLAASTQPFVPQPIVILNRPGAAGTLAAQEVARAAPDGSTLLMGGGSESVSVGAFRQLPYDIRRDFRAILRATSNPQIVIVSRESPIRTIADLVERAKASPGQVSYGSSGVGSLVHATTELLARRADIRLKHVPYQGGGPALQAVLAGQIDFLISAQDEVQGQLDAEAVRPLAVARAERVEVLSSVPTLKELGYDVVADNMKGLVGPAGLSNEIYAYLHDRFKQGLENSIWRDFVQRSRFETGYLDGPAFQAAMSELLTQITAAVRQS
jgi:tripartite-type tricarboxylate transporter receptor subunit TctC